ncbi:hypothetical protein B0A67_15745 [Flavobacterium aquidurense]|nr:hypothetical protein B0A67_15745 [Flavobacterium aquidurense]
MHFPLSSVFLELLERQFRIDDFRSTSIKNRPTLCQHLNVHVNYLNRAIKEVTGKSTTTHITERIITEAKALLLHTNLSVCEIGYAQDHRFIKWRIQNGLGFKSF